MAASSHPYYRTYAHLTYHKPQVPEQVTSYTDDITITSTHTSTKAAKAYIKPTESAHMNKRHEPKT